MTGENRYRSALDEILRILKELRQAEDHEWTGTDGSTRPEGRAFLPCSIKSLPARLQQEAADVAVRENPVNAPLREFSGDGVTDPARLTLLTSKYWGSMPKQLTVSFMESTPADLRSRIVSHLNAWNQTIGISFVETSAVGMVRISRGPGGYYSYLGTDIKLIPPNRQTMNLQNFTMNTPESEYRRVARHEAGHTLGFPHEHMRKALVARIDPQKAYDYFLRTQGWSKQMVDQQVLTPLEDFSIIGTEADQDSIMCYQLPGEITYDGKPIRGGLDINATDYKFAGIIYPKVLFSTAADGSAAGQNADDWDPAEDVAVPV